MNKEIICAAAHDLKPCSFIFWTYCKVCYGEKPFFVTCKAICEAIGISRGQYYVSLQELTDKGYITHDETNNTYFVN